MVSETNATYFDWNNGKNTFVLQWNWQCGHMENFAQEKIAWIVFKALKNTTLWFEPLFFLTEMKFIRHEYLCCKCIIMHLARAQLVFVTCDTVTVPCDTLSPMYYVFNVGGNYQYSPFLVIHIFILYDIIRVDDEPAETPPLRKAEWQHLHYIFDKKVLGAWISPLILIAQSWVNEKELIDERHLCWY